MIEYHDPHTGNLVLSYLECRKGQFHGLQCQMTEECAREHRGVVAKVKKLFQRTVALMIDRGTLPQVMEDGIPICHGFTEEDLDA